MRQERNFRDVKDPYFLILLIFASFYILFNIGSGSLTNWDEAVYANVSNEMVRTGDWLKLQNRGETWIEKPPLYMWLTSVFYRVFGINEFSARLTSSLFGIATVMLLYLFIKNTVSQRAAIVGSLILLGLPHYLHFAKMGMLDVTLTFFILLMIYLFWLGQEEENYLLASGICLGLAYLTKGLTSFLGLGILFLYCLLTNKIKLLFKKQFLLGIIISILIILAWYASQYYILGQGRLERYFSKHIFGRATHTLDGHTGGINFYQKAIFNKNKPWGVFLYLSVIYLLWSWVKKRDNKTTLIVCWIFATYLAFSLIKTKLHWYIIPIYPALAFSFAIFIDKFIKVRTYRVLLAAILIGLILQVPFSWAFKLDLSPETKKISLFARDLLRRKERVFVWRLGDDKEYFYLGSLPILSNQGLASKSVQGAYCIVKKDEVAELERKYGYAVGAEAVFGDTLIVRLKGR